MSRDLVRVGGYIYDVSGCGRDAVEQIRRSPERWMAYRVEREQAPGTYTQTVRGTVQYVENHSNEFFREMETLYPDFQVISASVVSLPDSVCMYIVYCI